MSLQWTRRVTQKEWVVPHIWSSHVVERSYVWMSHVTHMNETCHIYERDMSHIWTRHVVPHIWRSHVLHINETCQIWIRPVTYHCVLSQMFPTSRSHVTCVSYGRVMLHTWMSHVTHSHMAVFYCTRIPLFVIRIMARVSHMDESCCTSEWVMAHIYIWMCFITHVSNIPESCRMCHIWMSHATHMNASCHTFTYGCVLSQSCHACHTWTSHVSQMHESWHIFTYGRVSSHMFPTSWSHVACVPYEWVMSRVSHMNESCHKNKWVTSHIYILLCFIAHASNMWESCHMCHIWMSRVTHMNELCHTHECVMSCMLNHLLS